MSVFEENSSRAAACQMQDVPLMQPCALHRCDSRGPGPSALDYHQKTNSTCLNIFDSPERGIGQLGIEGRRRLFMALPVSVGDAILLAKIALRLGQAFTSGRKSAPAEFTEIQNLLYTLSNSLELLSRDIPEKSASQYKDGGADSVTLQIILNCRGTLTHLDALVAKYMEIKPAGDTGGRMWKDEIRKNWKKILWTKEGGDVGKLKLTLIAHINGLNLAVSVNNK